MTLRLQNYSITLVYKCGKEMHLADTLSRSPRSSTVQQPDEEDSFDVMTVSYISSSRLEELKRHSGWHNSPDTQHDHKTWMAEKTTQSSTCHSSIFPFQRFRGESLLSTMESSWKATRQSFLSHYKRTTSASCTEGILVLKLLDKEAGIVFWPTMTDDINKETESCSVCDSTILH